MDRSPHVLVADDDPYIRGMMQDSLQECGFTVTVAEDGERALALWREGLFDAIVMDLRMPRLCGCAAALQLRREEAERGDDPVPIIALTAVYHEIKPETYLACGMNDILPKPIAGQPLCDSVSRNISES